MTKSKKLLIAITGGIGSGKSTFTGFLAEQGYPVLYADDISKDILASDQEVRKEIIREFGEEAYLNNSINKKFLAENIFSNKSKLEKINSILHPRVREKIYTISAEYFKSNKIVFVEAALIYESKIEKMYDFVVLISAELKLRFKRTTRGKKKLEDDFLKRNDSQFDDNIKMKKADFIFINNGTKSELKKKAYLFSSLLTSF